MGGISRQLQSCCGEPGGPSEPSRGGIAPSPCEGSQNRNRQERGDPGLCIRLHVVHVPSFRRRDLVQGPALTPGSAEKRPGDGRKVPGDLSQ